MIIKVSSIFNTTPDKLWKEIKNPNSLKYVSYPLLLFTPMKGTDLEADWKINREYNLNLFLFTFIPVGTHRIVLKTIDTSKNEIISNEGGLLAKVWNHTIEFTPINANQLKYTDTIEIKAGLLTIVICGFAYIFYNHRQRRWKKLLLNSK